MCEHLIDLFQGKLCGMVTPDTPTAVVFDVICVPIDFMVSLTCHAELSHPLRWRAFFVHAIETSLKTYCLARVSAALTGSAAEGVALVKDVFEAQEVCLPRLDAQWKKITNDSLLRTSIAKCISVRVNL